MNLQDQVCTLEQAKRLKELGVDQNSPLRHYCYADKYMCLEIGINNVWFSPTEDGEAVVHHDWKDNEDVFYSGFTVAELGVMIGDDSDFNVYTHEGSAAVYSISRNRCVKVIYSALEAHIRGEILIYQLENKLTTVEEVNERLNVKAISHKTL